MCTSFRAILVPSLSLLLACSSAGGAAPSEAPPSGASAVGGTPQAGASSGAPLTGGAAAGGSITAVGGLGAGSVAIAHGGAGGSGGVAGASSSPASGGSPLGSFGGVSGVGGVGGNAIGGAGSGGRGPAPTFTMIYDSIITPSCGGTQCHLKKPVPYGYDFSSKSAASESWRADVIPGDGASSPMFQVLNFGLMPKDKPPLTLEQLYLVFDWINAGALDN